MQDHSPNQITEELLNEEVSPSELREILQRLGQREFGGSPNSTIRDIAEGTSADPVLIGRLLAEIRNEELQDRLGLQVEEHEQRIEHIEHVQAEVQRDRRTYDPLAGLDPEAVEELRNVAEERRRERENLPLSIIVAIIISIYLIWYFIGSNAKGSGSYSQPRSSYSMDVNGVRVSGSVGGPYTANDHGKVRPATEHEKNEMSQSMAAIEYQRSKGK